MSLLSWLADFGYEIKEDHPYIPFAGVGVVCRIRLSLCAHDLLTQKLELAPPGELPRRRRPSRS